jgi:protein SCO1/2
MALLGLVACWGDNAYIVTGTVVEVNGTGEVVVAHEAIDGLMGAMTMPFDVRDPALLEDVVPGDRIVARLMIEQEGSYLAKIRVTGKGLLPDVAPSGGPLRPGQVLVGVEVALSDGATVTVGAGQDRPTAVTFVYTRCPMPEFCPAIVGRFQALQARVGPEVRLLAITLDPAYDTPEVLAAFASTSGADPRVWVFGRLEPAALEALAASASLPVDRASAEIVHGLRLLVLDRDGRLVERYDDARWPLDRVVEQLTTGAPPAPSGSDGTLTP